MAVVQCQRMVTGSSVRFDSQAPHVQTSRWDKQDNMNTSSSSVVNGVSRGSSVAFSALSVPPQAVGTSTTMPSVQVSSFLPPPFFGGSLEAGGTSSRTCSYIPQAPASMRFSSAPGLQGMLQKRLSSPSSASYPIKSVRMPVEAATGQSRARSPTREQRPPSPLRERRSSVAREQSPRRARSPIRETSAMNSFRPQAPGRPQSPIREHKLEQSFEQVLRDAVERARQASPIRQASSVRQSSPLRQTSVLQRQQSPLYRNGGTSVRMSSVSPLRMNSSTMPVSGSHTSVRFQSVNRSPPSPGRPLPLPELAAQPLLMVPPPALPSLPAPQSTLGAPMAGMFPLQVAQQHMQAPRFPGLNPELMALIAGLGDFKFTAEPDGRNGGGSGSYSPAPPRMAPGAMDDITSPPRHAPSSRAGSSILELSRERCPTFITNDSFIQQPPFEAPYGKSLAPQTGEGSDRHILSIMTSDNSWDSLAFSSGENIDQVANVWLQKRGLNPAFRRGLVSQMRQMVNTKLITAAVDIVDLL